LWEICPFELEISRNILLKQLVSTTPLKLLNRISWNLVGSKDTICSAYYQEILISWILWEICPFELEISGNILLKQLVSTTPLKLLNIISWNLVGSKDTICSCAYYQEMLIFYILWKLFANTSVISLTETCRYIYICTRVYHNVTISLKKFSSPIHWF
jgi:hypothetical protein